MPDWVLEIVNDRCPGFSKTKKIDAQSGQRQAFAVPPEDWAHGQIFGFAYQKEEHGGAVSIVLYLRGN